MAEETRSGDAPPLVSGADIRTFLFADFRGYTRFTQEHGDEAASALANRFANLIREVVPEFEGELIELRGDEALCIFRSARQALRASVEVQRRLRTETGDEPAFPLGVGMGLDAGEAIPTQGGYRGASLNLAARLCALAKPGEILATESVAHFAHRVDGLRLLEGRSATLKGMPRPVRYATVEPETPLPPVPPPAHAPRRSRLAGWGLLVAGGLLASAAIAGSLFWVGHGAPSSVGLAENSFALVSAGGAASHAVSLGNPPAAVATDNGRAWLADYEHGAVVEVNTTSGQRQSIPVGAGPDAVAVGAGAVWVANAGDGTLNEINPAAGIVVGDPIYVGNGPSGLAATKTAVWVALSVDGAVARIDPTRGRVLGTYPAGPDPTRIAIGFGKLWVTNESVGTVTPVDPATGVADAPIPVGRGPNGITIGAGAVWVTNSLDGTVSRIDPNSLTVTTYPVGGDPQGVVVAGKAVWVAASDLAQIVRLDASTGQVRSRLATGADPQQLALSGAHLAVTTASIPSRHRGGTLRIAVAPLAGSIDPQSGAAWLAQPWSTFAMTNDGLLGLKRVAGPEGNTVVADLAEFIPTPTDGGRTYTFQLRHGVRYSTGALVRASDVRYGIERSFTVNPAPTDFDLGGIFFSNIVGAKRCDHRVRCDLSGGIVTNDQTGRITFHLQHPDPDFLAKLATPIAAAVPASVPRRDSRTHPVPATGSYAITRYQPGQGATLIRNPYFHQWSRDAQPAGYPDRIVFRVYHSIDVAIPAVEHGSADLLFGIQQLGNGAWSPSPSAMQELATRYATQIHPAIVAGTVQLGIPGWLARDRLGRLAISYALDRRKISALLGGPLLAQPTCQLLPPNFPGYRPYCPYTIDPGQHAWSAPDVTRAKQLARRSRNYGRTIIVQSPTPLSAYLLHLLDTLGYEAHLQTNQDPGTTVGVGEFLEDYPGAADFIQLYAPPFLQHEVHLALAQQLQSPYAGTLAWAALDRRLTDYAAPPFIATERTPGLVSKRVGNFTTASGPGNGPVIDQLWVK